MGILSREYIVALEFGHKFGRIGAMQNVMTLGIWCLRMRDNEGSKYWLTVLKYLRHDNG
jgi:hypothetical protein